VVALDARVLLRRFLQKRERRQLERAVGFELRKIEVRLFDLPGLRLFGRRRCVFHHRRKLGFQLRPGEKTLQSACRTFPQGRGKPPGPLGKAFGGRDKRKLNGEKQRHQKNDDQDDVRAGRIEVGQKKAVDALADQSAGPETLFGKGNAVLHKRAQQTGACERKKEKAQKAREAEAEGRAQKILKRQGQKRQRDQKRGAAQEADEGIRRIGADFPRQVVGGGRVYHEAREGGVLRRIGKKAQQQKNGQRQADHALDLTGPFVLICGFFFH